jgi:antitoxin (DNA-binding transcriptional repressor) of toxin-antitoxin stability system
MKPGIVDLQESGEREADIVAQLELDRNSPSAAGPVLSDRKRARLDGLFSPQPKASNRTLFLTRQFICPVTKYGHGSKTMGAAQFKEKCLSLLDTLGPEGIIVTKHGKPVAKVVPIEVDSSSLIGSLKGKIQIRGEIMSTGLKWDAES